MCLVWKGEVDLHALIDILNQASLRHHHFVPPDVSHTDETWKPDEWFKFSFSKQKQQQKQTNKN